MKFKLIATITSVMLGIAQPVLAQQNYPDQPVRLVHGFGPGGNADMAARLIADPLGQRFGQPFVVEPKPGAGGQVAAAYVANEAPDGHTLLLMVGGHSVIGALHRKLNFEPVEDFTFINRLSYFPFFIATRAGTYPDIETLVAASRDGGRIKFGSAGAGTTQHLTGELLGQEVGGNFLHIPYKGDAGAVAALMGGEVDMVVSAGTSVLSQVQSGELDLLAVTWDRPWDGTPDVPTLGDTVAPGFNVFSWLGIGAPKGLSEQITQELAVAIDEIVMTPEVSQRLYDIGHVASPMDPATFRDMVVTQIDSWNDVIDAVGIERR